MATIELPTRDMQAELLAKYNARTPASRAAHQRALRLLPGGINRNIVYHTPHPLFLTRGEGAYVEDVDGNRYLDLIGNYSAMILGHSHPAVIAAAESQLRKGTAWTGASALEGELAEHIAARLPSVEQIRFTTSGTEATLMAIRAARAHTGRPLIAKFEGGYHGFHDYAMVSVAPPLKDAGPIEAPAVLAPAGIPPEVRDTVVVLPFNRPDAVESLIRQHSKRLAAVIVEPIMGVAGVVSPAPGFLTFLKEVTERHAILLIFDEIISFRVAYGGAQEAFGVQADLTTLGKVIGGGFPIGAVGGRRDVMRVFDPTTGPRVLLSGTFQANPVALASGIATLNQLTPAVIKELNVQGNRWRMAVCSRLEGSKQPIQMTGISSLFNIHLTDEPITDYRSSARGNKGLMQWLHLALLNEGVMLAPRGMGCLSVPMTERDLDFFIRSTSRAMSAAGLLEQEAEKETY